MHCRKKSNVFFIDNVNTCMFGLKSSTQESLESGAKTPENYTRQRNVSKKILNFRSLSSKQYPEMAASGIPPLKPQPLSSVYSHDYSDHSAIGQKMKPPCKMEEVLPDPEYCRRPINVFYTLPTSRFKFMDDHLKTELVPEGRKKIDFFRQIR